MGKIYDMPFVNKLKLVIIGRLLWNKRNKPLLFIRYAVIGK